MYENGWGNLNPHLTLSSNIIPFQVFKVLFLVFLKDTFWGQKLNAEKKFVLNFMYSKNLVLDQLLNSPWTETQSPTGLPTIIYKIAGLDRISGYPAIYQLL